MFDIEKIGNRIKQRRESLNLTLDEVATAVGVDKSTIMRYEKGLIDRPKIPVLHSIAIALDVRPEWLLGQSDQMEDEASWDWDSTHLKEVRTRADLSIEDIALRLGIPASRYKSIESGEVRPTIPLLISIAQICKTSVDLLLGLDMSPQNNSSVTAWYTEKDIKMIEAYHRAGNEVQRIIDLTLAPYQVSESHTGSGKSVG